MQDAHQRLGLVLLEVAHEVQGLQHVIYLALALLGAAAAAEVGAPLLLSYLLPVTLLQQRIPQHWHLHRSQVQGTPSR